MRQQAAIFAKHVSQESSAPHVVEQMEPVAVLPQVHQAMGPQLFEYKTMHLLFIVKHPTELRAISKCGSEDGWAI